MPLPPFSPSPPPLSPFPSPCSGVRDATDPWEVRQSHRQTRTGSCASLCIFGAKVFHHPLLRSSYEPPGWRYSAGRDPPVMKRLLRSRVIKKDEGRIRFGFFSPPPPRPFPHMDIRGSRCWRTLERGAGQMAGPRGRAGCALAGPHPVALICFYFFFLHQSFSLSPSALRRRSSAGAVTPVIPLSVSFLTPSFLYLSPYLLPQLSSQEGLHVSPGNNGVRI